MKINSAKSFRFWYKTKIKEIDKNSPNHNENFVGTYHNENGKKIKGFFEMYHGDKPDIASYLPSILKIAEDGQAIYEFLQNAVDCNSTHFYIFYNEKYFLAINNGSPFDIQGLQSVLNIAQTTKKTCDKIGRFGIGFKLVHRLVGKNEGISELVNQYKGPILFSWSKLEHIQELMKGDRIEPIFPNSKNDQQNKNFLDAPYLLKIILTNFPTEPDEIVKDLNYQDKVLFRHDELNELITFLNENFQRHTNSIKLEVLKQGTLFFLKLGEGKKEMLDKDYEDLKKGIQYSMNTLKKLQKVYINSEEIGKQTLELEEFEISKNSKEFALINPEYKECNIKVSFGYYRNYKQSEKIKASPNFYKYFPMGDETNGFSFIIHCDSFSNEANRRKLQKDSTNKNLLPVISKFITTRLDEYKKNNREQFLRLYACLLLSDVPNKQNNEWLKPIFYDDLLNYLRKNIPTQKSQYSDNPQNVKIKNLNLDLDLSDFGLDHIQWFEWKSDNDFDLVKEAKDNDKLALETWDFSHIILNCDVSKTNEFILKIYNSDTKKYGEIINQINEITDFDWKKDNFKLYNKFSQLSFFHFQVADKEYFASLSYCLHNNIIILQSKHRSLKAILEKLDLFVSSQNVDKDLSPIGSLICEKVPYIKDETKFYEIISKQCVSKSNKLSIEEKQLLFKHLQDLQGVGDETIKKLPLFTNNVGQIKPLCELVDSALPTPTWINSFKIKAEENFAGLKKYLISEKQLYQEIILTNWEDIISEVSDITEFYSKVKYYYNLNENNTPLKKQAFVFVNEDEGFVPANDVFYNSKFLQISTYKDFQNAVYSLTDTHTPHKEVLEYLKGAPFKVENTNLFDYSINDDTELDLQELKSIIEFCKSNNESFFEHCVVEKQGQSFIVSKKASGVYQVRPAKKEVKQFIEENFDDTFKILPYELDEYKDEIGIIQGEKLYDIIVDEVDIDEFKEELVNILAYDEPKRKFLLQLSEIRLVVGKQYDEESFEYKVLNLACNVLKSKEYIETFKEKVVIETNEQDLTLAEIPPFEDKIKIEDYELSLAKILPNTYEDSNHLSSLIQHFASIGIDKERLISLFGINQETDINNIFQLFSEQTDVLENAEQLAFLFLYGLYVEYIDFSLFKALNIEEDEVSLEYDKYLKEFAFIEPSETLHQMYKGVLKIFKQFPILIENNKNLLLIKEPYFNNDEFICPYIKEKLFDEEKLELIEFLFNQWDKKNKKTVIRNIDWANINEVETKQLLGFHPNYSVYPSEYALEGEELPEYLQEWLGEDNTKINFIADLGVFTEGSTLLALRKFFNNEGLFNKSKIAQDSRLDDGVMLFNTFEWLKEKEFELSSAEEFEVFEEMVRVINLNRGKGQELIIQNEYDFELLENEAEEWNEPYYENWKEELEDKFSIYLFEGALPKIIKLDEIEDYIFYRFNDGDVTIDDENRIFVNRNTDIKKALSSLIADENNEFSAEDLLLLYQTEEKTQTQNYKVEELLSEIERLTQRIAELEGVAGRANYDATVSFDESYHHEIKEKSERYLFEILRRNYPSNIIVWLNYNETKNTFEESWKDHDFEVQDRNKNVLHYIDCKGTPQQKRTFYLTSNEWNFFLNCIQNGKSYQIYRIFNVESNPYFVHIDNLWEWIKTGKVVPYLSATETVKGGRVFLTLK